MTSHLWAVSVRHHKLSATSDGRNLVRNGVRSLELLADRPGFSGPDQGVSAQGDHESATIRHVQEHTLALSLWARTVTVRRQPWFRTQKSETWGKLRERVVECSETSL